MPTLEYTDHSSETTADESTEIMGVNGDRRALIVQNLSDTDMWANWTGDAAVGSGSFLVAKNGGFLSLAGDECPSQAINLFCTEAAKEFTAKQGT